MKIFTFTSGNEYERQIIGKHLKELPKGEYLVEIKKNFPSRSLNQNKYYHAILNIIAIESGHTRDEIANMFKMARHYEEGTYPSGKMYRIPKSTHDLDTKEFTAMCNNLEQWAREEWPELIIPQQKDLDYKLWMEIENRYKQVQSGM